MIINNLRIFSYGKFKEKNIELKTGLNIIEGENESGKSTIMSFIRAMLYGFSGKGGINSNERKKYKPWDSDVLIGEMSLTTSDGKELVLYRKSGKTQSKDEYIVKNSISGENESFDAFDELSVHEDGFKNTLYIKQAEATINGQSDEINDRLINLLQNGDENAGYNFASETLKSEMKRYKLFKGEGGLIFETQKNINQLETELANTIQHRNEQLDNIDRLNILKGKAKELLQKIDEIKNKKQDYKIREMFIKQREAENKSAQLTLELKNLDKQKQELLSELNNYSVFENTADEIIFESTPDKTPYTEKNDNLKKKEKKLKIYTGLSLCGPVLFAVLSFINIYFSIISGISLILAILSVVFLSSTKKQIKENQAYLDKFTDDQLKCESELLKFGCKNLKEYTDKKTYYLTLKEKINHLNDTIERLQKDIDEANFNAEKIKNTISNDFSGDYNITVSAENYIDLQNDENELNNRYENIIREIERLSGRLDADMQFIRTEDVIMSAIDNEKEKLYEYEEKYTALKLASDVLDNVYDKISRNFSPKLNKNASEILSKITGHEEKIIADKKYNISVDRNGYKELAYFSYGMGEQVYLAMRIAIIDIILGKNAPIFLDDIFAQYDENRCKRTMEMLKEISRDRQIILFTCRHLETDNANIIKI